MLIEAGLAGTALVAAAVYAQPQPLVSLAQRWSGPDVLWCHRDAAGAVALSIDDVPHGDGSSTEAILDELARAGVKATFFVISGQVTSGRHRAILARIVADGHELGNHMATDCKSVLLGDDAYAAELDACAALLREHQPRTTWHRPVRPTAVPPGARGRIAILSPHAGRRLLHAAHARSRQARPRLPHRAGQRLPTRRASALPAAQCALSPAALPLRRHCRHPRPAAHARVPSGVSARARGEVRAAHDQRARCRRGRRGCSRPRRRPPVAL